MKLPVIQGVIDRRILVNYRVDPSVLARLVPPPFEPKLVNDYGIAGICLIRLKSIRPRYLPEFLGISSENAAHRIAVRWTVGGESRQGVYIPRRDSSSRLNNLFGGRLFPGIHHRARFEVEESTNSLNVWLQSDDGTTELQVKARLTDKLPPTSVFHTLDQASTFFEAGSLGYSPTGRDGEYDALELRTFSWDVAPLEVDMVRSSFFEDGDRFPRGSVEFDCGLLMRGIRHEWLGRDSLYCDLAS
jgi:hypothetical protein